MELFRPRKEIPLERRKGIAHGHTMTNLASASENDLLARIKAGDEEAFIQLYRNRQGAILRFALQMCGSRSVAEDVTQEVFLALIREAGNFDPARGSLSSYLYGMARNMVLDHLSRARQDVPIADAEAAEGPSGRAGLVAPSDPLGDLTRGEGMEALRKAILALPPHYREVVVLCDLNEMDYARAAGILGCAVGTVRSRLHRARELILKKLCARGPAGEGVGNLNPARCAL